MSESTLLIKEDGSTRGNNVVDPNNASEKQGLLKRIWMTIRMPILAFVVSILAGAVLIIGTDLNLYKVIGQAAGRLTLIGKIVVVLAFVIFLLSLFLYFSPKTLTWTKFLQRGKKVSETLIRVVLLVLGILISIGLLISAGWKEVLVNALDSATLAYGSMLSGSIGSFKEIGASFASGDMQMISDALYPLSESLVAATPYILSGLAVAIAFRCGIFNIGTEGQIILGALFATIAGYGVKGLPAFIHIPLVMLAGALGGALWAFIPAILKTKFKANEVINTIMLNYVAFRLSEYLLNGPIRRPDQTEPFSPYIEVSARLPRFFLYPNRLHLGIIIAIAIAVFLWWFLFKTTIGLEIRLVGQNKNSAKYAGININKSYLIAFCLSGALAGLAGANEIAGVNYYLSGTISPGYGFDAISLSILGNNHPLGVILTALLFGTLRNGGTRMQNLAQVPVEIITVVQSLVIAFIAAPVIIKTLFRLKGNTGEKLVVTKGWGK